MNCFTCRPTINFLYRLLLCLPTALLFLGRPLRASTIASGETSPTVIAQTIPDNSLGGESSYIVPTTPTTTRVEGGAIRGNNLFHSFEQLNVVDTHSLYFANPADVVTIFSRVTGDSVSNIFGTLGVDGPASLFLLNPNGMVFGPNAALDIQGSFLATTAEQFTLADGVTFSATNPAAAPILNISTPIGLQPGTAPLGNITSQGRLAAGETLTLEAHQISLEGEVNAGKNLTLQASDTITIRDSAKTPFLATSGNHLTIQGNRAVDIWTLQHLDQTPFVSGGNLTLISDGQISGDAHFESGGNLQFLTVAGQPGNFVSRYDPIIFANGDVVLGDYEGVALKVEATGSIQAGRIRILGPDTTLTADGSGSDEDLLASSSALIFRAGVQSVRRSDLPLVAGGPPFSNGAVTDQPPGSIVVTAINTSSVVDGGDGGPIILAADGNITTNPNREPNRPTFPNLDTLSRTPSDNDGDAGNGGDILITSIAGDIELNGRLSSFSQTLGNGSAGNGGNVVVSSESGNIVINERINSFSLSQRKTDGNAANAGHITVSTVSGNITTNERFNAFSSAYTGNSQRGGDITISSQSGNIQTTEDLETFAESFEGTAGNGGNISLFSATGNLIVEDEIESFAISRDGSAGNGGNISFTTTTGNIVTEDFIRSFSFVRSPTGGRTGNGGNITFKSTSGDITTNGRLSSFASTRSERSNGGVGDAGNISITSISGDIAINRIDSSSTFFPGDRDKVLTAPTAPTGNGGNITIESNSGNITNSGFIVSESSSRNGDVGRGGNISLTTQTGSIRSQPDKLISTIAVSEVDGNTGAGGTVTLEAPTIAGGQIATISSGDASGDVTIQGLGNSATIRDLKLITSGQLVVVNPGINASETEKTGQTIILDASTFDRSGTTVIMSEGNLTLDNIEILSDANRVADAGDLEITSGGNLQINNSRLLSNANPGSSGNGGSVVITSPDGITLDNTRINNNTEGSGQAGSIQLRTPRLTIQNGAQVTAATSSTQIAGGGGDIRIAADAVTFAGDTTQISVSTSGPAAAGSVTLSPFENNSIRLSTANNGPQLTASTTANSRGRGGDIIIENAELALLRNTDLITSSDGFGNAGNIRVDNVDVLVLRQGSLLQAGASANGDGGNINIDAAIVFAVPDEDNDILADTTSGTGGTIEINADSIIGFREVTAFSRDLRGNIINDISARSERGNDGTVNLITPNLDPEQGLIELPENLADQSSLIAERCLADSGQGQSAFVVTGRGGIPPSPNEVVRSVTEELVDLGPLAEPPEGLPATAPHPFASEISTATVDDQAQAVPSQLLEAQGWSMTASGAVQLLAQGHRSETPGHTSNYRCFTP